MRLKKLGILVAAASLLASCGNDSIYSTYSFQLGKKSGTNFAIQMKLDEKQYKPSSASISVTEGSHSFTLDVSARTSSSNISVPSAIIPSGIITSVSESAANAPKYVDNENASDYEKCEALYVNWAQYAKGANSTTSTSGESTSTTSTSTSTGLVDLKVSIGGSYVLEEKNGTQVFNFNVHTILGMEIPPAMEKLINKNLDKLFFAFYENNTINIVIPVSLNDLAKQIQWLADESHRGYLPPSTHELYFHTVTISLMKD